jgi:hypothetical protein
MTAGDSFLGLLQRIEKHFIWATLKLARNGLFNMRCRQKSVKCEQSTDPESRNECCYSSHTMLELTDISSGIGLRLGQWLLDQLVEFWLAGSLG